MGLGTGTQCLSPEWVFETWGGWCKEGHRELGCWHCWRVMGVCQCIVMLNAMCCWREWDQCTGGKEQRGWVGVHWRFLEELEVCYIMMGPQRWSGGDCDAQWSPTGAVMLRDLWWDIKPRLQTILSLVLTCHGLANWLFAIYLNQVLFVLSSWTIWSRITLPSS